MIEPYNPYLIPCKNAKRGVLLNIAEQFWKHVWHHFWKDERSWWDSKHNK